MKSTLNAPANVVNALTARKAGGNYYTKPVAVINDAIANHENVTFTFTSYDGYVSTAKSHLFQQWVEADRAYGYLLMTGTILPSVSTSTPTSVIPTAPSVLTITICTVLTPLLGAPTSSQALSL